MSEERLQKILARAGIASRRKAEELITEGRVKVNGQMITELGSKADLDRDHIKVDGKLLHPPRKLVYIALNKPKAVVTTVVDPQRRETVMDFVKGVKERVYPVGRLDYHSEGLILLTNDGEFANRVTAARTHLQKTYVVKVTNEITQEQEMQFREGIYLHGKKTAPAEIKLLNRRENPWYEVKLIEGRQNQIRLMFRSCGVLVEKLRRVKIGFLELTGLKPGDWRYLTDREVEKFRRVLKMEEAKDAGQK
jgi:23S rRNA pseudouridine2605 synthase